MASSYERFFSMINRTIRQRLNRQLKPYGLNESNFMLVLRVCEAPGISQDQLNHEIYREHSIVTKAVNRLAKNGWISIENDANDGRRTKLFPTALAQQKYAELKALVDESNQTVADALTPDEQKQLEHLLAKIAHVMISK